MGTSLRTSRGPAVLLVGFLLAAGCGSTAQTRTAVLGATQGAPAEQLGQAPVEQAPTSTAGAAGTAAVPGTTVPVGVASGAVTPSVTGPSEQAAAQSVLTTSGPGWDKSSIYFGVSTEEDLSRTLGAAGISFYPGSIQGDVRAIVADLNARGGLLGRKLVPVFHDNAAADVSSNPEVAAQENCAAFTQDRHVVAVLNPIAPIESDSYLQCMKNAHTSLLSIGYSTYADDVYRKFGPYLYTTLTPNVSRFVPSYIPALKDAGYFGGWDANSSKAKSGPAVVGILEPDTSSGHTLAALQSTALKRAGIKVGSTYFYREDSTTYGSDMSAAVLSFRNAGVSHLLDITNVAAGVLIFAETAQQQRFFPRYGMTSWLLPDTAASVFAQAGISQQLNGAIGIGWTPGGDVNAAHDPGKTAPQRACEQALARQGITYSANTQRFALNTAWALCDDVNLLVAAATRGGGLSPEALRIGLEALSSFQPAVTFSNGLSVTNHSVPGSDRALVFDPACDCFAYKGPARSVI